MTRLTYDGRSAEEWRAEGGRAYDQAQASFDRCDTDGFLSQWASNLTARLCELKAQVAERGGMWEFPALMEGDRVISERTVSNRFGSSWLISSDADAARLGRRFIPVGSKSRVQSRLGLHEGKVERRAFVTVVGSGTGLSGAASARAAIVRHRDQPGGRCAASEDEVHRIDWEVPGSATDDEVRAHARGLIEDLEKKARALRNALNDAERALVRPRSGGGR